MARMQKRIEELAWFHAGVGQTQEEFGLHFTCTHVGEHKGHAYRILRMVDKSQEPIPSYTALTLIPGTPVHAANPVEYTAEGTIYEQYGKDVDEAIHHIIKAIDQVCRVYQQQQQAVYATPD